MYGRVHAEEPHIPLLLELFQGQKFGMSRQGIQKIRYRQCNFDLPCVHVLPRILREAVCSAAAPVSPPYANPLQFPLSRFRYVCHPLCRESDLRCP